MDPYHTIEVSPAERRRHARTPIGLPVRVHFAGRTLPVTVELRDASPGGCYFTGALPPTSAKFAFGFLLPDQQVCLAAGRVLRVDPAGFAATLSRSSDTFDELVERLSGPVVTRAA